MAPEDRTTDHPVIDRMLSEGHAFEFCQAIHVLSCLRPDAGRLGTDAPPGTELVRLRPSRLMSFPAADVRSFERIEDPMPGGAIYRLTTTFLGLYGVTSPLPFFYSDMILNLDEEEQSLRDFLDIFHHRLLSLLYRCWSKYRYHVCFTEGGNDAFSQHMLCLVGLGTRGLAERLDVPAIRMIRYAGPLTQRPRSAAGLAGVLTDYHLDVPVRVEQCQPRWVAVKQQDRNRIGHRCCTLGVDLTVGERIFDLSGRYRVVVGPVGRETFEEFLPIGARFRETTELAKLFVTDPLELDVEVILTGEEVPEMHFEPRLGGGRLGWNTWTKSLPIDDQSVVLPARRGAMAVGEMLGTEGVTVEGADANTWAEAAASIAGVGARSRGTIR